MAAREPSRARALYERARTIASRTGDRAAEARAEVGLGRYLAAARRYHDARVRFEQAAGLDTLSAAPFYYLARASLDLGDEVLAVRSLARGLRREPEDPSSVALFQSVARSRCAAAGLPADYAALPMSKSVTRGELGVMIAVELGLDPERLGWASDGPDMVVPPEVDGAWGARWLRASVLRGYLRSFPDGSLHLEDPVTRGQLALTLAVLERGLGTRDRSFNPVPSDSADLSLPAAEPSPTLPDLGPRSYLRRAAARAVRLGLPTHAGGAFDPAASASGAEVMRVLDRLARMAGRSSSLPPELREALVVQ